MKRVFLLDDDEGQNFLNILLMHSAGITDVVARTSVKESFPYLDECKKNNFFPDVLFVDLNLHGINGFKFLDQYEERYPEYSIPPRIIVLSNSILEDEKNKALNHKSVINYWSKPLTKNKLHDFFGK